jgi:uncharacterized Zn-finger protein
MLVSPSGAASPKVERQVCFRNLTIMQPFEIITVDTAIVCCNGGGGALGHPAVYLNLAPKHQVECPYCSRLFVRDGAAAADAHVHA